MGAETERLEEKREVKATWNILVQKAIIDEKKKTVLWPEVFPYERLVKVIRPAMGELAFAREYQNEPAPPGGLRFRPEWVKYFDDVDRNSLEVYMAVDPAVGKKDRSSYFAVAVVGVDRYAKLYVLDVFRERLLFGEQVKTIYRYWKVYQPKVVGIEDVFYQNVLLQSLDELGPLPLIGIKPKKDKIARIDSLAPFLQAGRVSFKRGISGFDTWLREEYLTFPESDYMDGLDALSYAVGMAVDSWTEPKKGALGWMWF